jgi:hypothetical protein
MMARSWQVRRGALVAAGMTLALLACNGDEAADTQTKPDPAEVAGLAKSYTFVNPRGPVPPVNPLPSGTGVPDNEAPTAITIARAVPTVTPAPSGKVILALVHSDRPYKHLGIAAGDNYVWRDESNSKPKKWVTYMVPAGANSNPKQLKRGKKKYSDGEHSEPRLVRTETRGRLAFGACLDDPACGSGHCGYGDVY